MNELLQTYIVAYAMMLYTAFYSYRKNENGFNARGRFIFVFTIMFIFQLIFYFINKKITK